MENFLAHFNSPIGNIQVIASEEVILSVQFKELSENQSKNVEGHPKLLTDALLQLEMFFSKKLISFNLPINTKFGTSFQQRVWSEVSKIPFGKTKSYLEIASALGDKNLVRAVGAANGQNPLLLLVPCHRVIGVTNELVGYAGELWRKKWLLEFESPSPQLKFNF